MRGTCGISRERPGPGLEKELLSLGRQLRACRWMRWPRERGWSPSENGISEMAEGEAATEVCDLP